MDAPDTIQSAPTQPAITDPQMDTNKVYEQEHERQHGISDDQPIQLAQNDIVLGAPQYANPNNAQVSDSDNPIPHIAGAVARPIPNTFPGNITGGNESRTIARALAERSQARDVNNFSNGDADYKLNHTGFTEDQRKMRLAATPTAETHNIVQAPDGSKVAFPKGTPPETMHQEMTKWWEPRVQQATAVWDAVRHAATNAAQAIGLPSDMPEWQASTDEFMRDPISKTGEVVGAVIGGLAHGFNSIIPNTPENQALAARATEQWKQGNHQAAAATLVPLIGDGLAKSITQAQSGDISGSLGTAAGVVAPFLTESFKGEGELPITREKPVQPTTTSYEHTPDQSGQFGNYEHVVTTKNVEGKTVGHLAAQDTAPGEVTIRSNQIYDDAHRGQGKGTAAIRTLVDETAKNPSLKTIHSDITTTGAARGAWKKIAEANPDTVTKQDFNGVPRWSVDLDKVREKAANAPEFNGEERRGARRGPLMKATDIENNLNTGKPVRTPFDVTEGAMDTINRDLESRLAQPAAAQTVGTAKGAANDTALFNKAKEELGAGASISDIARRAQTMKIAGTPTPEELPKPPMEVRHWSKGGVPLTETNPEKFGTGRAGAERARANEPGFVPRTYFGMDGYKEPEVQSGLEHSATLDPKKYYDKDADPQGIWKKGFEQGGATGAERAVKDAGYHGYYSPNQQVAASFEKVPVKVNPEAMQLKEHSASGGSTFTPEGENLKGVDKYAVGDHPERTETVDKLTPKVLKDFKDRNADLIAEKDHSVGTWHDTKAGNHVLDISKLYDDRDEAVQAGKAANQQSIYHLGGEGEIPTGGTGEYKPEMEAARKDYNIEKDFSKDVLSGKKNVQDFPYYDSYKRTIDAESKELPKGGKVLFIGGGPMPLSSMMLADKGFDVDTLELDPATAKLGQQVAEKAGAKTGKFIPGDARDFKNYGDYDAVVTSLEAGPESESKRAVLKNIMEQVKPGTKVLARGTADTGGEQFVNTDKSLPDNAIISKSIDTFDGLSKTHVLDKAGTPKLGDLWHDETGTYTSGQFMKYLAKNKLMSKAGSETLDAAAKKDFVPGWAEVSQFLTPEDRANASRVIQKNVVDLVNKFNPEWVQSAAEAGSVARGWYQRATSLVQHLMGDDAHRFTNFIASLSPQKDVEQNFTDALNFYNSWVDAGKPTGIENEELIKQLVGQAEVGMSGQVARDQLIANLVHDIQPTGPKVSNFARNLKGYMDAITKDRWVAYMFGGKATMFSWFDTNLPNATKPAVHLAADAVIRAVGKTISMLPAEVQETSWSFMRTVVNMTETEGISPRAALKRVTDKTIQEGSSELVRLIADSPKVQSALNRLATATGNESFRADVIQGTPKFKQLLKEHQEQPTVAGGARGVNRATAERGVKQAIAAREIAGKQAAERNAAKKSRGETPFKKTKVAKPKPAPAEDEDTSFNPEDMSSNIRPNLRTRMTNALS